MSFRLALACGVLGFVLAVLGVALAVSRVSNERANLDRRLATTAAEKSRAVQTDLAEAQNAALLTSRIPPFAGFYAASGSRAGRPAAARREIEDALEYDWQLHPDRFPALSYVDRSGAENARVVGGRRVPWRELLDDVRAWPSFALGMSTPAGEVRTSRPFLSPTAHVEVVASTTPVVVGGRRRAYVEVELATDALRRDLELDLLDSDGLAIVDRTGSPILGVGRSFRRPAGPVRAGIVDSGSLRVATRAIPAYDVARGPWYLLAAAPAPSAQSEAFAPTQAALLGLAVLLLAVAAVSFRRARSAATAELSAEQEARAHAERLARVDALTRVFNRRHAVETVEHELARGAREGTALGLVMFDIDRFKRINDRHGHAGGDAVLVEVARRLRTGVREWDVVARFGGEEFCVIAPGMSTEDEVADLGDRLRRVIAGSPIPLRDGVELAVTASAGAVLVDESGVSAEYVFDCADRALYAAKRRGRNRLYRFGLLEEGDRRAEQPECLHLAEALALASDLRKGTPALQGFEVAELAANVALRLGLTEEDVLRVRLAGWLHDVGTIAVPDEVLAKPGPLAEGEWQAMRRHPVVGDELLRNFPELSMACAGVRHHHERYDGSGYPDRLAGDAIPLDARIVAAVDAYAAMTADRPYRRARTHAEAVAELKRCAGTQFDPLVVDAVLEELAGETHAAAPAGRA